MGNSKIVTFVMVGALTGAAISLLDKSTRQNASGKFNKFIEDATYYAKNPSALKSDFISKKEKVNMIVQQVREDAEFMKEQLEQIKSLTPQVQQLLQETKDSFVSSKSAYKSMVE